MAECFEDFISVDQNACRRRYGEIVERCAQDIRDAWGELGEEERSEYARLENCALSPDGRDLIADRLVMSADKAISYAALSSVEHSSMGFAAALAADFDRSDEMQERLEQDVCERL